MELGGGEDVEAALLAGRDDQATREGGAEARRQEQPPLVVEPGRVRTQELVHGRHLLDPSHPPGCTGFLHFTPPGLHRCRFLGLFADTSAIFAVQHGWCEVEENYADTDPPDHGGPTGSGPAAALAGRRGRTVARGGALPPALVERSGARRLGWWSAWGGAVPPGAAGRPTPRSRPGIRTRWTSPNPASVRQDRGTPRPRPVVGRDPREGTRRERPGEPPTHTDRDRGDTASRGASLDQVLQVVGLPGRRDELGDRGQAGRRAHRDHRAARRGPPARRGRAGRRQDAARQDARPLDRLHGAAGAVHPRPAAQRHHRRLGVQPGRARLRVPPGRDLRQRRGRRRDQPRLAQDPERAAGVDGGGARSPSTARPTRCPSRSW